MEYVLSLSYGKDSIACIEAIKQLDLPLDRIIHAELWATDTISADLPSMVAFKKQADAIIKKRYGIKVEHISYRKKGEKWTYEKQFYTTNSRKKRIYGFPLQRGIWCNSLKKSALNYAIKNTENAINYIGIAVDEEKRIERWSKKENFSLPLVEINWSEADCFQWCKKNNLLSPIYQTSARGGCWFCHNQSVAQLRNLRKNHPQLWEILLQWDADSPTTFTIKHTIHDFEKRFALEEKGLIPMGNSFQWEMLQDKNVLCQITLQELERTESKGGKKDEIYSNTLEYESAYEVCKTLHCF